MLLFRAHFSFHQMRLLSFYHLSNHVTDMFDVSLNTHVRGFDAISIMYDISVDITMVSWLCLNYGILLWFLFFPIILRTPRISNKSKIAASLWHTATSIISLIVSNSLLISHLIHHNSVSNHWLLTNNVNGGWS